MTMSCTNSCADDDMKLFPKVYICRYICLLMDVICYQMAQMLLSSIHVLIANNSILR
ncbi:hypothetical protein BDV24DRAFT_134506 [Aspergillus arachidicola]|uniref:Uncharacterized protein n=1 Tax=Aspergillus arachidicola TaxID=656916 RepID=A0A5N6Y4C0_9EURO|nr:hypothetical protein BDV24DRAFT_134506 [Aspergillus arachidicola]